MSDDTDLIAEALPAFLSEAEEQVENLEKLLLLLEDQPADVELLNALFRCAHTVKGSAGLFGLDEVVAFTHHVETVLQHLREGKTALTPNLSTLLLRCNDQIRVLVAEAAGQPEDLAATGQRTKLIVELQAISSNLQAPVEAPKGVESSIADNAIQTWIVTVAFGTEVFRNGMDPLTVLSYVHGLGRIPNITCELGRIPSLDTIDAESCYFAFNFSLETHTSRAQIEEAFSFVQEDCELFVVEQDTASGQHAKLSESEQKQDTLGTYPGTSTDPLVTTSATSASSTVNTSEDQRFIRVQAHRLDTVINLLGELVIASAGAELLASQTRQRHLIEANGQISRLVEEIRNGTLQLRMVPIGETFSRFRRVVRDTAAELNKSVQLEVIGGDTELDKSVVECIADPLMHLVRNALDHGLETAIEREAAGKAGQGRLAFSAHHEAGTIVIRISDDGRGIQRRKVLERAWERGLLEQGTIPDDEAILQLIFEPGFSTAAAVTNLSGRGVGMDVVRSNINALRGSVRIDSVEGQGSTIEIRLPLTLAIIDGFLVAVGSSRFIFPLDAVVEVIEEREVESTLDIRGRGIVELRGQVLPVVSLRTLYDLEGSQDVRGSIVVLKSGHSRFGVLVDVLLGQHQTVIKPLGRMFRCLRGISGTSILGNGDVALIFDVHALGQLASEPPTSLRTASLMTERIDS